MRSAKQETEKGVVLIYCHTHSNTQVLVIGCKKDEWNKAIKGEEVVTRELLVKQAVKTQSGRQAKVLGLYDVDPILLLKLKCLHFRFFSLLMSEP